MIFEYLDIAVIIALSRTANGLNLMPLFRATAHNLNHQFRHYFSNPAEFWELQKELGMLIGGRVARAFFTGRLNKNPWKSKLVFAPKDLPRIQTYLEGESYKKLQMAPCNTPSSSGDQSIESSLILTSWLL